MRTVSAFPTRSIRTPSVVPHRTARLVSVVRVFERVAELIDRASVARDRRRVERGLSDKSLRWMVKLARELDGPVPELRVLRAVEWYERHCTEKYAPWIEGGETLYQKFSRLEQQMRQREGDEAPGRTVDEVVADVFNGSRVLASTFREDVLGRAKKLDLGRTGDADLASRLGEAYVAIRMRRQTVGTQRDDLPSPLELIGRYLDWLGEQDWRMTTRVLAIDSPAFTQFIRDEAARHPRGVDPLTGADR